jgi:hypothetical protein
MLVPRLPGLQKSKFHEKKREEIEVSAENVDCPHVRKEH